MASACARSRPKKPSESVILPIPDEAQGSSVLTQFELPLLLARPIHLRLCMPTATERPRWISFLPLEDV